MAKVKEDRTVYIREQERWRDMMDNIRKQGVEPKVITINPEDIKILFESVGIRKKTMEKFLDMDIFLNPKCKRGQFFMGATPKEI